jgi:hypothetical protein
MRHALWMQRFVSMGNARMAEIKGPAIAIETFRVEGHCCGIRIPALMDLSSAGVQFEMSPEITAELLKTGIHYVAVPQEPPREDEIPEPQIGPRQITPREPESVR